MQEHLLAWSFFAAGQRAAEHDAAGTGHQRLGDVAGIVDAAVGDAGNPRRLAGLSRVIDGRQLRHAHAGHHTRGADGARPHADLDRVDAGIDHRLRALAGGDVAADDLHAVEGGIGLDAPNHVKRQSRLAVCRVDDQRIDAGLHQRGGTLPGIAEEAHARGHAQTALLVLGRVGVLLGFDEVLNGDQAGELAVLVNQRKLLDLVLRKELVSVLLGDVSRTGDEILLGHHVADLEPVVVLGCDETHIAVGDDAHEPVFAVDYRQAGDVEARAQLVEVGQRHVRIDGERIGYHARFAALDDIDLCGLVVDGEIAMQHADAAVAGHGDCHIRFGDCVHRGGEHRDFHGDLASEMGCGVHFRGDDIRLVGKQQHIVVGQAELGENGGDGSVWEFRVHIRI